MIYHPGVSITTFWFIRPLEDHEMGYRPRSDLIYGVTSDDLEPNFEDADNDESLLALYGIEKPDYNNLPEGAASYYDALNEAVGKVPVVVGYWGDDDSRQMFYGVRVSHKSTDWDDALSIDPDMLVAKSYWDEIIADFQARAGLYATEPGWLLLASYG